MNIRGGIQAGLDRLYKRIELFATKYHRSYLGIVCIFALLGYAFVLLFPSLVYLSASNLYYIIAATSIFSEDKMLEEAIDWRIFLSWLIVLLFSLQATYRLIVTRPVPAVGFTMPESKIPRVYSLVDKLQTHFKRPAIQRIIITANYELDIVKTPRWMLPVWSRNTLIIGLPLLICMTPKQFEHMVARRIGQYSKKYNPLTNWVYQLSGIWKQYSYIYGKQKYIESRVFKLFYLVYAGLYEKLSVYVARADELYADRYAMELYNHDDICEMITADSLCRWYLKNKFWPAIDKVAAVKTESELKPNRKLVTVIRSNLTAEKISLLKRRVFREVPAYSERIPSLKLRLENIGHDKPEMKENTNQSAAEFFLGASLNGAVNLMDKLWFKNNLKKQKKSKSLKNRWVPVLKRS